jgi:hypothetical protein
VRFNVKICFSNRALNPNSVYSDRGSNIDRADEITRWRMGIALTLVGIALTLMGIAVSLGLPQDWNKTSSQESEREAVSANPQANPNQEQAATKPSNRFSQPRLVWQRARVNSARGRGSMSPRNAASLASLAQVQKPTVRERNSRAQAYRSSVAAARDPIFYSSKSGTQVQFEDRTWFPDGVQQFHPPRK